MITVNISRRDDLPFAVEVQNHGDPIVCSAVSMLMLNFANSLEMLTSACFEAEAEEGYMLVEITEYDDKGFAKLLFDSLILGLRSLEEEYGSEVKLTENGGN